MINKLIRISLYVGIIEIVIYLIMFFTIFVKYENMFTIITSINAAFFLLLAIYALAIKISSKIMNM